MARFPSRKAMLSWISKLIEQAVANNASCIQPVTLTAKFTDLVTEEVTIEDKKIAVSILCEEDIPLVKKVLDAKYGRSMTTEEERDHGIENPPKL